MEQVGQVWAMIICESSCRKRWCVLAGAPGVGGERQVLASHLVGVGHRDGRTDGGHDRRCRRAVVHQRKYHVGAVVEQLEPAQTGAGDTVAALVKNSPRSSPLI